MGRKSKNKKIIREMVEEKAENEGQKRLFVKKKSKKELKEELKKSKNIDILNAKSKKTQKKKNSSAKESKSAKGFKINHQKIFGAALSVIMLVILVSVGYLLFQKAFKAAPIAQILPAETTIATIEINTNFEHNQLIKTFEQLKGYPEYSKEELIKKAEAYLSLNYESDLKPWLGRNIGAAMLQSKGEKGLVYTLVFAEFLNQTELENLIKSKNPAINEYSGYQTYMIEGPFFITLIDDYVLISPDQMGIYELIDAQNDDSKKLSQEEYFRKIDNNLPLNKIAYFYINFKQVNDAFFKHFAFLSEKGISLETLQPFLKLFDAEGAALIATEDNFILQSFVSLDEDIYKDAEYLNFQDKYNGNLTSYLKDDILVYWGGENLEYQLKRFVELLAGNNETSLKLFDGIVESYTEKYFGTGVSFKEDILPLFAKEFALVLEPGEKLHYQLLIELQDQQSQAVKIHELANSFSSVGAIFEPKLVEHVLEDGTVGKEIVAVAEEIQKSEIEYSGEKIYGLLMGEHGGIYYTILQNFAVIGTSQESVKTSIDLAKDPSNSLKNSAIFEKNISPVLKSSDEISYFNIEGLLPLLIKEDQTPGILKIFSSLSSGRNYFNDGVVTINYLQVK